MKIVNKRKFVQKNFGKQAGEPLTGIMRTLEDFGRLEFGEYIKIYVLLMPKIVDTEKWLAVGWALCTQNAPAPFKWRRSVCIKVYNNLRAAGAKTASEQVLEKLVRYETKATTKEIERRGKE